MSSPRRQSDSWIDRQLRDVAIPSGLLGRLEDIGQDEVADSSGPDNIPVIAGKIGIAAVAQEIDAHEIDVAKLELSKESAALDQRVRDVPLPKGLIARLQRISQTQDRPGEFRHLAAVAALMLAVGLSYTGAIGMKLAMTLSPPETPRGPHLDGVVLDGRLEASEGLLNAVAIEWIPNVPQGAPSPDNGNPWVEPHGLAIEVPEELRPASVIERGQAVKRISSSDLFLSEALARTLIPRAWKILGDFRPLSDLDDRWPDPEIVPWQVVRGVTPPRAMGFNLPFQLHTGTHPVVPVDPRIGGDPGLRFCQVPLRSETFTYELARRLLEAHRTESLEPRQIRVEDFLAAVDYGFDPPKDEALRLHAFGGPSPFGESGAVKIKGSTVPLPQLPWMLQVGVQARAELEGWRQACRLTVLVDRSRSMGSGGRLEMVRQALSDLSGRMGPADRLSLVTFDGEASVLLEDAGVKDRQELLAAIGTLKVGASTNVVAGLQTAYTLASAHPEGDRLEHRVVLLTDGAQLGDFSEQIRSQLERGLAASARDGLTLTVIDLGDDPLVDPQLLRLAEAGGGTLTRVASAQQIGWALSETLTGRSQLVAEKAQLKVQFHPDAVESYRLLGHEASDLARLEGATLEVEMRVGQSATALFEIRPKRQEPVAGRDEPVATIELRWVDPFGGERTATRTIHLREFVQGSEVSPVSLERAAVVAETAEILRRSPFVERGGSLKAVREFALRVRRESDGLPSFERFLEFLVKASSPWNSGATGRR